MSPAACHRLGRAMAGQGRIDEACEAYRAALDLRPHDGVAARNLLRLEAAARALAVGAPSHAYADVLADPGRTTWARLECRVEDLDGVLPGDCVELAVEGPEAVARSTAGVPLGPVEGPVGARLARLLRAGGWYEARLATVEPGVLLAVTELRRPAGLTGGPSFPAPVSRGIEYGRFERRDDTVDLEALLEPFEEYEEEP